MESISKPECLPENESDPIGPVCAGSLWNRVFEPQDASVVLVSGEGGTGKTHAMVELSNFLATKLHHYVLTNAIFLQKTRQGFREVQSPHPRIRTIKSMRELWYEYAIIIKEYQALHPEVLSGPVVVPLLDEWHKYMKRLAWFDKIVLATLSWWGENRKYQTVPTMITQKMTTIPRQLLPYVKWYIAKSKELTKEYGESRGHNYFYKELAFLIPIRTEDELERRKEIDFTLLDVVQPILFERGLWTGALDNAKVGEICWDPRGSADFKMGEVNGSEDWFDDFMGFISSCPGMMVADKILQFFDQGSNNSSALEQYSNADIATHLFKKHQAKMDPEATGYPLIKVSPHKGRKLVSVELNPTNLARITDCSQATLARKMERMT